MNNKKLKKNEIMNNFICTCDGGGGGCGCGGGR